MEAETDAALVLRARSGDAEAFGCLVQRHMRRAYAHALALVGSREDALDLSQEAFARAYQARHRLDPDRPLYAWLGQIVRRLCLNFLRDSRTHARLLDSEDASWFAESVRPAGCDPGANAVINVRFGTSYIMGNASEILAYGEAVVVEKT